MTTKISILIHEMNLTGVPMAAINLANGLDLDTTIIVIGEKPSEIMYENAVFLGVKRGYGLKGKVRYLLQSLFAIAKYLRKEKVKNLFIWSKEFAAISVVIKPRYTKLIGVNATDMKQSISTKRFSWLVGKVYSLLLRNVPMIAQSKGLEKGMREYGLKNITTIYPPLDKKFFNDNTTAPERKIVWIGSLTERKQPEIAIQLSKELKIPLEMIGDGKLMDRLERHEYVALKGNQSDITIFLRSAGVLILTSKFEGFGMVLAEAIAQGVPVVSFDCPHGPGEIIINGINGYLASGYDEMKMQVANVLNQEWDKKELRNSVMKFHPDKIIVDYKNIIDKVFK